MEAIQGFVNAAAATSHDACRVATPRDAVLNSECCYTFHSPYRYSKSGSGIFVSLTTFVGTTPSLCMIFRDPSEQGLFLRIVKERTLQEEPPMGGTQETEAPPTITAVLPTKLAIGVEGGFLGSDDDRYETIATYSVVLVQNTTNDNTDDPPPAILAEVPYTDETKATFPVEIQRSVDTVVNHVGVAIQQDVQAWQANDDDDGAIGVSKYCADLIYVDNGVAIDPNPDSWKCGLTGATTNLWLNLSDGYIGGGRKNWDGSGGSGGALDHYNETGQKYPLVVKLGTITADLDTADCYSYAADEDGLVKIPNLAELLEKRGIKVAAMQKTVKSTAELEVELNANYAFDAITEAGAELQVVSGPGLIGLQNLGNSCYMNSIFQLLLSGTIPELTQRYGCGMKSSDVSNDDVLSNHPFLKSVAPTSATLDVLCQTTKLACALTSGVFAKPIPSDADSDDDKNMATHPKYRLAPRMMKYCIGKDHVDFRTSQQQDAAQFLQYFLERLDRAELGASSRAKTFMTSDPPLTSSHLFSFQTTERLACAADNKIKYNTSAPETIWSIRIPMDKVTVSSDDSLTSPEQKKLKQAEESEDCKERIPVKSIALQTCLEEWSKVTTVDDIRWSHLNNEAHSASHTVRLTNFPRYLIIQIQRYALGADWVPVKLEVDLEVPQEIDLTFLKSMGVQEDEVLVPDQASSTEKSSAESGPAIDEAALSQLMDMGFSLNSCKRALVAVGGNNVEAAMSWVFEHNMDTDFNDPLPESNDSVDNKGSGVDEDVVQSLVASLGAFTADHVRVALKETSGSADRAADWLFSRMDDLDGAIAALNCKEVAQETKEKRSVPLEDSEQGMYALQGMVSHIGKNTGSGHYVTHLKKDGKWVIFNDEKVALSSKPPFEHAYVYLFQRKDTIGSPMNSF